MNSPYPSYPPLRLSWIVWGLGGAFYLIAFFHRVAPAVLTRELMRDFSISATALGNLSAFYFYSYWLMQIPTGVLADAWGPRRLLTTGALGASAGALLFALSPNIFWAGAGRFLIGGCVAVAFVANLKLAAHWFPARYFSMISGIGLMAGIIGAVTAGVPLRLGADAFGWRAVMMAAAAATSVLAAVIWVVVRNDPGARGYRSHAFLAPPAATGAAKSDQGVMSVFGYPNTWLLFLIPSGLVGSVLAFSGLWGVPFLTTHYGLSTAEASSLTSAMLVAWALASPVFGRLSDRIGRRKPLLIASHGVALVGWAVLLFVPGLCIPLLAGVMLATGLFSAGFIITFAQAKESVPARHSGMISGVVNMGIMMGPTVLQPAIGWMLDQSWRGEMLEGARVYSLDAYRFGFALMPAWIFLSLVLIFFTRETYCRQAV